MNSIYGVRKEDKNKWERRTPLIPAHVKELKEKYDLDCRAQASDIRIHPDKEYEEAGAKIVDDLKDCPVIFAVKEIPKDRLEHGKTYVFFSHTVKGQAYNMPLLCSILDKGCTIIDYERISDIHGRRIVFFGRHAGLAGMIDTLWALGKRLDWEGVKNPFSSIKPAWKYGNFDEAKDELRGIANKIRKDGLTDSLVPFFCGFIGYGNVSKGAQEVFNQLPVEEIRPVLLEKFIESGRYSNKKMYKVVFEEEDTVNAPEDQDFDLHDYYTHPERYEPWFGQYLPHLTLLVNAIYWDKRYPKLVTKSDLKQLFEKGDRPRLRVIGDISCDVEGAIECNLHHTQPNNPVYVYDPFTKQASDGVEGKGVVVLAVDNLPCEMANESSADFSEAVKEFVPAIVNADYSRPFEECSLPAPVRKAVIAYQGKLTPKYEYLRKHLG